MLKIFSAGVATVIGLSLALSGCTGSKKANLPLVRAQTPAEEVLRIGKSWNSSVLDKGILSKPSPVSFFRNRRTSSLELSQSAVLEKLIISEELELRDGSRIQCETRFKKALSFRWLRTSGEAGIEITRPAFKAKRNCSAKSPQQFIEEPSATVLLVLRGDQLVAIEPKVDDRVYIPRY